MTTAQATMLGQNFSPFGVGVVSTASDGSLVLDNGMVITPDGSVVAQTDFTPASSSDSGGFLDSLGSSFSQGIQTFASSLSRIVGGQVNPQPYWTTGGGFSGGTLLLIGGAVVLVLVLRNRRGSPAPARVRRKNPSGWLPGAAWSSSSPYRGALSTNAGRRRRRNPGRVRFYGAFGSAEKARRRARSLTGAIIKPTTIRGSRRWVVETRP